MLRYALFSLFFFLSLKSVQALEQTLGDIVENIPEIGNFESSKSVSPIGGKVISLNGEKFEVRFFFFQNTAESDHAISFKDYLKSVDAWNKKGKTLDLGYGKIIAFSPSVEEKEAGIYYMLSLRPLASSVNA